MITDLPDLKRHLRVDHDDEDRVIAAYALAAEQQVQSWLGRPIYARAEDMPTPTAAGFNRYQMVAPEAVKVAIYQMADRMYHDRGGDGGPDAAAVPPMSVRGLLSDYRVFCEMPPDPMPRVDDDSAAG